jgi:hypothetical protein
MRGEKKRPDSKEGGKTAGAWESLLMCTTRVQPGYIIW